MLASITLGNFKSYERATVSLAPLTLLIGSNASGKSNALEALRLLKSLAQGKRFDQIERDLQGKELLVRGQLRDLFRNEGDSFSLGAHFEGLAEEWSDLAIELALTNGSLQLHSEKVTKETLRLPLYAFDAATSTMDEERIAVRVIHVPRGSKKTNVQFVAFNRQALFYQLEPLEGRFSDYRSATSVVSAVCRSVRQTLESIVFLEPRPERMRDYVSAAAAEINEDGSNLSAILYGLVQDKAVEAQLLEFVRSLPEQEIAGISFIVTARNDVMVQLVETFGNRQRTVDAPLLSDGTLRVLAVGAALLSAPAGSVVVIEEIDNGVHPSRAKTLIHQIHALAQERKLQVLLTSHNPALLDAVPDDALADVLCCYRDPQQGDSRIARLGDLDRFPELIARGPLGQLMTQRVLERFVKDQRSPAERQEAALAWLQQLESQTGGEAG